MDERYIFKEKIKEHLRRKLPRDFFLQDSEAAKDELRRIATETTITYLRKNRALKLYGDEQRKIIEEIVNEILGLGPLENLLADETITEIMVNGINQVYIEREGKLELTDIRFGSEQELMQIIERILAPVGRRINETDAYTDARLKDGSRVSVVISPISAIGPIISIHKFAGKVYTMEDLINFKTITEEAAKFLEACVKSKLNIIISGGTSCGKTTLLNILSSFVPKDERIIVIEDTLELKFLSRHVVRLEARPPNIEGKGEVTIRDLVKNALHMRPDRIIIGEIRGEETLDMLQAMNTGHEGSMTTLHANAPYEALNRIELMALMGAGPNISAKVIMRQIILAADLIVHLERSSEGVRRITHITEVIKDEIDQYLLKDIYSLSDRISSDSEQNLELIHTGFRPSFYPKLKRRSGYINAKFEGI
jgi:pilus assembly protein CpaF